METYKHFEIPKEIQTTASSEEESSIKKFSKAKASPNQKLPSEINTQKLLYEFCIEMLTKKKDVIKWENEKLGVFKIVKPEKFCELWSKNKRHKKTIEYADLKRNFRLNYTDPKKGYFKKVIPNKHNVHQFGLKAVEKSEELQSIIDIESLRQQVKKEQALQQKSAKKQVKKAEKYPKINRKINKTIKKRKETNCNQNVKAAPQSKGDLFANDTTFNTETCMSTEVQGKILFGEPSRLPEPCEKKSTSKIPIIDKFNFVEKEINIAATAFDGCQFPGECFKSGLITNPYVSEEERRQHRSECPSCRSISDKLNSIRL